MTEIEWTPHESALWRTCEIINDLVRFGRWPQQIQVGFARQLSHEEEIFLWGDYQRSWFGAVGDGSYQTSTFFAGGFSPVGVALGVATLGASAAGNAARKSRARKAAQATWRPFDAGQIYVSTHGFYLVPGNGVLAFGHPSIVQADLGAPGVLLATISMDQGGQEQFAITSMWAELIFVMWARAFCPGHPRLSNLGFLPAEFVQRAEHAGVWATSPMRELSEGA